MKTAHQTRARAENQGTAYKQGQSPIFRSQLIRVSSLEQGTSALRIEYPAELLDIAPQPGCQLALPQGATADLSLFRNHGQVYISGEVSFRALLTCADCGVDFQQTFTEPISIEFQHGAQGTKANKVFDLGGDELDRSFYVEDEIDLLPLVRDTVLLAIPLAPLCRPDCKGLCPDCGANLNTGTCTCAGSRA